MLLLLVFHPGTLPKQARAYELLGWTILVQTKPLRASFVRLFLIGGAMYDLLLVIPISKPAINRADSPASIMSQAKAIFIPAPTAAPFTAAIVGRVESAIRRKPRYMSWMLSRSRGEKIS